MTYHTRETEGPTGFGCYTPGIATSTDGENWVKGGKVLSLGAPGSWDEGGASVRHVLKIGDQFAGLSIYGNLLIESVSSVFHFRRVPFFNKKNKALFQTLEVRGAFADHQMTFPCHLLHSCSIDGEL
jgi:hypothetical protein